MQENEKAAHQLNDVRQWAKTKIDGGQEPPWSWYQYMKLIETIDTILESTAFATKENLQQSDKHQDVRLQLVDSMYLQGNAQPHQADVTIQMPM